MKRFIFIMSLITFAILSACSSDDVSPNDQFDHYVKKWTDKEFADMYDMVSSEAQEEYATEDFVDRYEKIYSDLAISDLDITFSELTEDDVKTAMKEGTATIPFKVDMDSLAGPISFTNEAALVKEEIDEEKESWFIEWDPGFIFPELKDGGDIALETTSPSRGEILDRNKMPLALNDTVREIGVVPEEFGGNSKENKEQLSKLLHMSVDAIDDKLNASWVEPDLFVPLKTVLATDTELLNQLGAISGVRGKEATGRVYPLGEAAAHLVGYVGQITAEEMKESDTKTYTANDLIGKRGLEQLYEDKLRGESGATIYVKQEGEKDIVLAEKEVQNGENINLTIDVNIQEKIYNTFDEDAGTAAAIDPHSGETLALVSSPAYDPNEILYGTSDNKWKKLEDDPQTPLINRFKGSFAPGSVMKPVTAAVGLNNGSIDPNKGIEIKGKTWSNGDGWGDYKVRRVSEGDGPVDLSDALIRSDNIYFAMQAVDMGSDAFTNGLKTFGFGEDFPYEYPMTTSTVSNEGTIDNEVMLANTSYGQGEIQFNPLHLALAYTPFLNDGNLLKSTLLLDEETKQVWHENILSSEDAQLMQDILRDVVTKGTAKKAQKADFPISGKTGTAELKLDNDKDGEENGWFVGYPTDDQDILIAMMIEQTEDKGGSGYTVEKVTEALSKVKE